MSACSPSASWAQSVDNQSPENASIFLTQVLKSATVQATDWTYNDGIIHNVYFTKPCVLKLGATFDARGDFGHGAYDATINFGTTAAIEQKGTTVYRASSKTARTQWFTFSTESLASRVAYAMEYLRNSCDQTASTGF